MSAGPLRFALLALLLVAGASGASEPAGAVWKNDCKIFRYKGREFIVGTRGDALSKWFFVGTRAMAGSVYADAVFPMTIESQDSFVIYDKTKAVFIVSNVAVCCKGKDTANDEKTDWVGELKQSGEKWAADIMVVRKHDRRGKIIRVPYYSMGRDFPIEFSKEGACVSQYNYFGNIKFKLVAHEVPDGLLRHIVDDHDKLYRPVDDRGP